MESLRTSPRVILLLLLCAAPTTPGAPAGDKPKVILVSMDGFRHDYLSMAGGTPNFDRMLREGVTMPWIRNTFTTLTFPCHFTMVTGLFEESHGIVANSMYDQRMDRTSFGMPTTDEDWWTGHDTIWTSAQKAGLKAGVYFWVGSASKIQGVRPDRWFPYDNKVPFEERVDTLVKWMSQDDLDLGLLYFNEPDHTAHVAGPRGADTMAQVRRMDGVLGRLMDKLDETNLLDRVNLIVTSDHGMADVDSDNQVRSAGTQDEILVTQAVVNALKDVAHMKVMLKEEIPERFHYRDSPRVQPVLLLADEGWGISENATWRRQNLPRFRGDHGYDNILNSMKPIFVARGPAFKQNTEVEPMDTVDIYPLMCHLLNIEPAPNNGSLTNAARLLRVPPTPASTPAPTTPEPRSEPTSPRPGCLTDWSTRVEVCSFLLAALFLMTRFINYSHIL
ncbi:hypothetical protein EGW08_008154 [Elysia chlorotica]|uniref:Uncharacterized protein n=1 Tax=Elysia chlorotica TaxID=188477 RepID=A0A433TR88_ELYCH|nr:hypothetical protein EGW08_008154 [Elysia chlorotica]